MVRHLALPGQIAQAKAVLRYIRTSCPRAPWSALMGQYLPLRPGGAVPRDNRPPQPPG